jgi:hypothetical protein
VRDGNHTDLVIMDMEPIDIIDHKTYGPTQCLERNLSREIDRHRAKFRPNEVVKVEHFEKSTGKGALWQAFDASWKKSNEFWWNFPYCIRIHYLPNNSSQWMVNMSILCMGSSCDTIQHALLAKQ